MSDVHGADTELAATPQRQSQIARFSNRLEDLHQSLDHLLEKTADLGTGYHDLLEHLLAEEPPRRGGADEDVASEVGHRRNSLPYLLHRVNEAGRKVELAVEQTERDLEAQQRVYEDLLPDL